MGIQPPPTPTRKDRRELIRTPSAVSQIADILIERMNTGEIRPGQRMSSGLSLASEFGVSRATIRNALNILATRGLIRRHHGVGVFAAPYVELHNSLNVAADFFDLFKNFGFDAQVHNLDLRIETASEQIRTELNLNPDSEVMVSRKIYSAAGDPKIYCTVFLSKDTLGPELSAKLERDISANDSLFTFLEERSALRTEFMLSNLSVLRAEDCPFPSFPYDVGTPVLVLQQVGYGSQEYPIWCTHEYYPDNSLRFGLVRRRG